MATTAATNVRRRQLLISCGAFSAVTVVLSALLLTVPDEDTLSDLTVKSVGRSVVVDQGCQAHVYLVRTLIGHT